jgi:2-keto-3-deoxy-L-rhamnonate aldolase RhmA
MPISVCNKEIKMILSWQQIPSTLVSEILCINSEGVVLDTEHGWYDNQVLFSCIQVIKSKNKHCFVRLTDVDKKSIRYCLDSGVDGIVLSTIETIEQCEKIVEYSFYAPRGKRGLGLVRQNMWGTENLIKKDPIIIPQIETLNGVENLEKIKSFGFDYYLIGPYDLSLSIGDPGNFTNEEFLLQIQKFNSIIPEEKRAVHIPNDVKKNIKGYENYGIKCLGMDTIAIIEYHKEVM